MMPEREAPVVLNSLFALKKGNLVQLKSCGVCYWALLYWHFSLEGFPVDVQNEYALEFTCRFYIYCTLVILWDNKKCLDYACQGCSLCSVYFAVCTDITTCSCPITYNGLFLNPVCIQIGNIQYAWHICTCALCKLLPFGKWL